jgi:putative NADH-flavin reductase
MPKAVVFGATGYAGSHIVHELLARSFSVTAIARNVEVTDVHIPGVAWHRGSFVDFGFVHEVAAGSDVIVSAVPSHSEGRPTLAAAIPHLLDAAANADATLAVVGGAGSLQIPNGKGTLSEQASFPAAAKQNASAHAAALETLRTIPTRTRWFYLSPPAQFGAAFDGPRRGTYRLGRDTLLQDPAGKSTISGVDYALAFVDEIEMPQHPNMRFTVAN